MGCAVFGDAELRLYVSRSGRTPHGCLERSAVERLEAR